MRRNEAVTQDAKLQKPLVLFGCCTRPRSALHAVSRKLQAVAALEVELLLEPRWMVNHLWHSQPEELYFLQTMESQIQIRRSRCNYLLIDDLISGCFWQTRFVGSFFSKLQPDRRKSARRFDTLEY